MNPEPYFVDSNVWLYYLLDNQSLNAQERQRKRKIARSLTEAEGATISVQVVNEVCSNVLKKAAFTEQQIKALIQSFEHRCTIVALDFEGLIKASDLRSRYHLSF
ncbi:PIN domain-containing protein [Phormidesmis sp. 146-12]